MNIAAFRWGRRAAVDPAAVEALVKPAAGTERDSLKLSQSFDEMVARRVAFLTDYQNAAYARALPRTGREGAGRGSGESAGAMRRSPKRWRAICSS